MSTPRERLAAIPHFEVSRRTVEADGGPGVGPYTATLAVAACGRELPTTLTTRAAERVRCPSCKEKM